LEFVVDDGAEIRQRAEVGRYHEVPRAGHA
jgi:hypothetical protein